MLSSSLQGALCCWPAQSPPPSPALPCSSDHSASTCTCSSDYNEKAVMTNSTASPALPSGSNMSMTMTMTTNHYCPRHSPSKDHVAADQHNDDKAHHSTGDSSAALPQLPLPAFHAQHPRRQSQNGSVASSSSSRSSYFRGLLFPSRKSPSDHAVSSQNTQGTHQPAQSRSPSKKFSLQQFYYPRNTITVPEITATSPPSPGADSRDLKSMTGSFSKMDTSATGPLPPLAFEGPRSLGLDFSSVSAPAPAPTSPLSSPVVPSTTSQPAPLLSLTTASETAATLPSPTPAESTPVHPSSDAPSPTPTALLTLPTEPVSLSITSTPSPANNPVSPLALSSTPSLSISSSPPSSSLSLNPISLSNLSTSYSSPSSSASSLSAVSTPNTSPSNSPIEPSSTSPISSPPKSDLTPYPASPITPAKLAALMERGGPSKQGVSAGPRPLVLDLRAPADFEPVSIVNAITINLPTLLMRRYRKGGAVSAFALESFITMPADKELFHLIQDGWRQDLGQDGVEVTHDVVVLDQDMKTGKEEYGRSPSSAWTLVSVLERGGGNLGGAIRLWYLEGGFDAFQAWDVGAKHLTQPDSEMGVTQDGQQPTQPENQGESKSMPLSLPSNSTPAPYLDPQTAQAISNAVSMTTASLGGQTTRQRGAPARRESLFSLNTKSLQRPAGLSRSQTVGMGALNIKPLSIAPALPTLPATQEDASATGDGPAHPPLKNQSGWLTVPNGGGAPTTPSLSPAMSLNNNSSMDISQSASPDRSSAWSASSSGDGPSGSQGPKLGSKKSFSSTITVFSLNQSGVPKGIQEEDEGEEAPQSSSGNSGNPGHLRRYHSEATYGGPYDGNGDSQGLLQSRSFADGIDSYNNNFASGNLMSQHYGYDDENGDDGGDNGEQEISCILPNFLYLGPEIATEQQVQELERLGIKRVLNMARECEDLLVVNRPGIEYHKVGVQDHVEADVTAGFMQAVDIIAASNDSPIYVHCKAGKSRSVTAIIAYLITQLHWPLNKAYQHVLTQRPCMCPNIGFVTELMRMEERTLGGNERSGLARAGSLNSILSLSTAGSGGQSHHHHHHHSLQPHHSKGAAGSPKVLSSKSSVNNLGVLSPPFQQQLTDNGPVPAPLQSAI